MFNVEIVGIESIRKAELRMARSGIALAASDAILTREIGDVLLRQLKAAAPVGKGTTLRPGGELKRSITRRNLGTGAVRFLGAKQFEFVVGGTRAHDIVPKNRLALMWPGAAHPVKKVHHPGTKPNDFRKKAVERAMPEILAIARGQGRSILHGGLL